MKVKSHSNNSYKFIHISETKQRAYDTQMIYFSFGKKQRHTTIIHRIPQQQKTPLHKNRVFGN